MNQCLGLSTDDFPKELRQRITDRLRSMFFLCVYCDNPNPLSLSAIEYKTEVGQRYFTAFSICSNCNTKFGVKIQDYGKVK
jgi:5-methylcytosine-specific restriction endonuclease McrA